LSNYWTGAVPRFAAEDFWEGERLHERYRWPVDYSDLAKYYTYAEGLLGVVGGRRQPLQGAAPESLITERELPRAWRSVAEFAERLGHGLNFAPLADGPDWMIRKSGAAFNSFVSVVARLRRFPQFELRLGAHAQRLTWDGARQRIDGVEYLDLASGSTRHIAASAVVVAAGPVASPKLLLHSTSPAYPDGLGNSRGLVGRFLHDHPNDWCMLMLDRPLPRLDQPLHLTRAPYANSAPLLAASLTIGPLSKWDRLLSLVGTTGRQFGLVTFATMLPEDHNCLSLDPQRRDEFGMPVLDIHMRYGPEVAETVSAAHTQLLAILQAAGFNASIECPVDRLVPGFSAHYGGGSRMHASPMYGVLDGWNRVHGVNNVAVVDASSFTTAVEKNPTLTAMALAARAADGLSESLQQHAVALRSRSYAVQTIR
jgi:choline dehydrogenase-like flavoprotein